MQNNDITVKLELTEKDYDTIKKKLVNDLKKEVSEEVKDYWINSVKRWTSTREFERKIHEEASTALWWEIESKGRNNPTIWDDVANYITNEELVNVVIKIVAGKVYDSLTTSVYRNKQFKMAVNSAIEKAVREGLDEIGVTDAE